LVRQGAERGCEEAIGLCRYHEGDDCWYLALHQATEASSGKAALLGACNC